MKSELNFTFWQLAMPQLLLSGKRLVWFAFQGFGYSQITIFECTNVILLQQYEEVYSSPPPSSAGQHSFDHWSQWPENQWLWLSKVHWNWQPSWSSWDSWKHRVHGTRSCQLAATDYSCWHLECGSHCLPHVSSLWMSCFRCLVNNCLFVCLFVFWGERGGGVCVNVSAWCVCVGVHQCVCVWIFSLLFPTVG